MCLPHYGLNGSDNEVFIFFVFPVSESANKLNLIVFFVTIVSAVVAKS